MRRPPPSIQSSSAESASTTLRRACLDPDKPSDFARRRDATGWRAGVRPGIAELTEIAQLRPLKGSSSGSFQD